jgi:hypothetical protein
MNIANVTTSARRHVQVRRASFLLPIGVLAVIALLALGVRLATFERYWPYLDYTDESDTYLLARDFRGVEEVPVVPEWLAGYPPLYVWVNMAVQQTVEAHWSRPWILPAEYFYYTRLLSVVFGFLTTIVLMRLGWLLGGWLAAAFAGGIWAFTPFVVDYNSLALPDPLVYLSCAVALMAALQAWRSKSPLWLLISLIGGIAATYGKYSALFAIIPWGAISVALLRSQPRRWWRWILLDLLIGIGSAIYLVFVYGAFRLSGRAPTTIRASGLNKILDLNIHANNWYYAILPIGIGLFFAVVIVGVAAYLISRRRGWQTISWLPLLLILIYGVVGITISAGYSVIGVAAGKIRYVLPVTVGLIGFWAANAAQIYRTLCDWYRSRPARRISWLPQGIATGFAILVAIPLALGSAASIRTLNLKATQLIAQEYSDASLPADGLILIHPRSGALYNLYNRNWSGYNGVTSFQWWIEDPTTSTPQALAARGITYFVISSDDWTNGIANPEQLKQFVDQLTPLGTITGGEGRIGPDISFYRMLPPHVATNALFGDQIRLEGYDLSSTEVHPGKTVTFRPYWRALSTPAANYSMFVHVYPADELRVITQYDGNPALPARLTLTWNDPKELVIGADVTLMLPAETPLGDYVIALGLYDFASGQRLTTSEPQDDKFEIPIKVVGS